MSKPNSTFAKAHKYKYIFRNTLVAPSAERLENISDGHLENGHGFEPVKNPSFLALGLVDPTDGETVTPQTFFSGRVQVFDQLRWPSRPEN